MTERRVVGEHQPCCGGQIHQHLDTAIDPGLLTNPSGKRIVAKRNN